MTIYLIIKYIHIHIYINTFIHIYITYTYTHTYIYTCGNIHKLTIIKNNKKSLTS